MALPTSNNLVTAKRLADVIAGADGVWNKTKGLVSSKATKVTGATSGNFAGLDSNGDLTDSGKKASDFAAATHSHGNIASGGTLTDTAAAAAGNDYVVIRDADNNKIQTSTIKGTDVSDAVSKRHSHSTLTLSTTAQAYDGTYTLALPSTDPYTSARTPTSHTHGNITNDGKVGSTANLPLKTGTSGAVEAGSWATTASAVSTTGAAGSASTFSRGDHTHGISLATGDNAGQVKIAGSNVSVNGWSSKANLASPVFTGTPKAPTASAGTNTTQIATTAFVKAEIDAVLDAADAMQFKGTIGASADTSTVTELPATHEAGWTYKVVTAGTYAGKACEVGDLIICISDGTVAADTDWTVVQGNTDGLVTGPSSSVSNHIATFDGTSGKLIKDSGYTIATSVPNDAVFTDTQVTSADKHYAPVTASGQDKSASASGATAAWSIDVVKGVTLNTDGKGHVTGISVTSGKIPANPNTDIKVKATAKTDNVNYKILATASASPTSGNATEAVYDTDISLNPSTNTITASISGDAATASAAKSGSALETAINGKAASDHVHGNITNDGAITADGVAIANGDAIAIVDSSESGKLVKSSITFDGSTIGQGLSKKGTWQTFLTSHQTIKQDGVSGATVNRFGTCSIAAATAAKTVSITSGTFTLEAGATVAVKFSNANTASTPTLNVGSTGAKNIYINGAQITTGANKAALAGTVLFIYDGTQYHIIGNYDTDSTYTPQALGFGYGTCSTAYGTAAKAVTLSGYTLTTNGIVAVKFAEDVDASATMNINGKGAKSIFYRGAAITAGVIKAGDIATFIYDGTQYQLLSIDSGEQEMTDAEVSDLLAELT